jgi:alpha-mannosidase
VPTEERIIENAFYRVEISEDGSHIKSLYDKELDLELAGTFPASAGPLEFEFGMFELFGIGMRLSVPDQSFFEDPANEGSGESVDMTGEIWRAADYPAAIRSERNGTLSRSLVVEGTFIDSPRRQRVVLYDDIKRVDLSLELDWEGKPDTVLYLQMPNTLMTGQKYLGVPFGVHRAGEELTDFWIDETMPVAFKVRGVQDWLCFEKAGRGMVVATRWPVVDFTLVPAFPLMWTNDNSGFFFGERYRQAGTQTFAFSLTSYEGTWQDNGIHRWGRQWSYPALTLLGEDAPTHARHSYVSVEPGNIVMTTLKKAHNEDAIIVRLYESCGRKTSARLHTAFPLKSAYITNLIETTPAKTTCGNDFLELDFEPYEIKTIKLHI